MKNSNVCAAGKAFTLIELLVVVAIIALLLAILVPSLNKAKALANRIVCGNHLKTLTSASATYAAAQGGYFVPAGYSPYYFDQDHPDSGVSLPKDKAKSESCAWTSNKTFRTYVRMNDFTSGGRPVGKKGYDNILPKEFLCPSDKISVDLDNIPVTDGVVSNVSTSYGYNITDWDESDFQKIWKVSLNPGMSTKIVGHRADAVKTPAEKLQFIDSIDWWVAWRYADYRRGWDAYGQQNIKFYKDRDAHGPTIYRHDEGAVVGFYDGHSEYVKKEKIYIVDNFPNIPGMWTSSSRYNGPTWQPPIVP